MVVLDVWGYVLGDIWCRSRLQLLEIRTSNVVIENAQVPQHNHTHAHPTPTTTNTHQHYPTPTSPTSPTPDIIHLQV